MYHHSGLCLRNPLTISSTGTPSQRKTSNSPSAPNRTTGKSKRPSSTATTTAVIPHTSHPVAASTTSLDYPSSLGNKEYPQSIGSYQQQPQMDQRQMSAPAPKPSRLSYQDRQMSPERSHERERPTTSGQSREREQLRLSYQQPESDSTTQNVVRPRRTDDYYDRKRSSVRADYA
jgi:hypothetical protein